MEFEEEGELVLNSKDHLGSHQEPIIVGSLPGKPVLYGNPDVGFNDPIRRNKIDIEDKAIEDYSTDNEEDDEKEHKLAKLLQNSTRRACNCGTQGQHRE